MIMLNQQDVIKRRRTDNKGHQHIKKRQLQFFFSLFLLVHVIDANRT